MTIGRRKFERERMSKVKDQGKKKKNWEWGRGESFDDFDIFFLKYINHLKFDSAHHREKS